MIRNVRESHADQLRKLIHATINFSYGEVYPQLAVEFFKTFHSGNKIRERCRTGVVLIFEVEGIYVGTGALVNEKIEGVFVKPEFQGQGIGKMIMTELEKLAVCRGIKEVILHISLPSKKFYQDLGYTILEECNKDVGQGENLKYWIAKKRI